MTCDFHVDLWYAAIAARNGIMVTVSVSQENVVNKWRSIMKNISAPSVKVWETVCTFHLVLSNLISTDLSIYFVWWINCINTCTSISDSWWWSHSIIQYVLFIKNTTMHNFGCHPTDGQLISIQLCYMCPCVCMAVIWLNNWRVCRLPTTERHIRVVMR